MMGLRRNKRWLLMFLLASGDADRALAEPAPGEDAARELASRHFERGSELAQRAEYHAAALEFRQAYEAHPEPVVLFNLGQAYIASGQPIEAYDAFAAFLRPSDEPPESSRRRAAEHLMSVAEGSIGQLWIEVEPPGAEIEVDGLPIGIAPLDRFLRLSRGQHTVVVRAAKQQTHAVSVTVQARKESQIFVRLEPVRVLEPSVLFFSCPVPGVRVWVDGDDRGTIGRAGFLLVSSGSHSLTLRRSGYLTESATVRLTPGQSYRHRCEGRVDPTLDASHRGTLVFPVLPAWADARISVDGRTWSAGPLALPSGPHEIEVRGRNSERWIQTVQLDPGAMFDVRPDLRPTPEYLQAATQSMDRRRFWSGVSLATGAALIATSATLAWVSSDERQAWSNERDALNRGDVATEEVARRLYQNSKEALELRRIDDVIWGTAALGSASLALSAYLWLTAADIPGKEAWRAEATRTGGLVRYRGEF
jgi:hypothetical protein